MPSANPTSPPEQNPTAVATRPITDPDRYSRQVLFPGIGAAGQHLLAGAHVAIVGVGATGAASASLLARAGVGTLSLIDRDFVEPSNLHRQVLFDEADALASLPKAEAARRKILLFNSSIRVLPHVVDLVPANIHDLLSGVHLVLDATDNFETRFLINDFAVQGTVPWIYAAAIGATAATMNILPRPPRSGNLPQPTRLPQPSHVPHLPGSQEPVPLPDAWQPTACLACLFPAPPAGPVETCDTAGILSTAVNLAASIQVTEALKLLTGQPHLLRRTLLSFDLWQPTLSSGLSHSEVSATAPDPDCLVCGHRIFAHLAGEGRPHITLCGRNSVQIHEHHRPVDLAAMHLRLSRHADTNPKMHPDTPADIQDLRSNDLLLRFRRGPLTLTLFGDGRAVIQGTSDIAVARTLYARFIGS